MTWTPIMFYLLFFLNFKCWVYWVSRTSILLDVQIFDKLRKSNYSFELVKTEVVSHFRGSSSPSEKVCWISGSNGTVLKTTDGGNTWKKLVIPGHDKSDLRDIEAFDEDNAVAMGVGSPAKIFKTEDGGKTWLLTYSNDHPDIFLDGIAFFNKNEGLAFGDAIDNKIIILKT